jgi:hypothetical protein
MGHALAVELDAVGEALGLDGHGPRAGAAGGGAAGDGHTGLQQPEGVIPQRRVGLDQLGEGDTSLEGVADEGGDDSVGLAEGDAALAGAPSAAARMASVSKMAVSSIPVMAASARETWSRASKRGSLSSWRSRL